MSNCWGNPKCPWSIEPFAKFTSYLEIVSFVTQPILYLLSTVWLWQLTENKFKEAQSALVNNFINTGQLFLNNSENDFISSQSYLDVNVLKMRSGIFFYFTWESNLTIISILEAVNEWNNTYKNVSILIVKCDCLSVCAEAHRIGRFLLLLLHHHLQVIK